MGFRIKTKVTLEVGDPMVLWDEDDSREAGADMLASVKARFGSGKGPDGKKWKPYKDPAYARKNGAPDMVQTGGMRDAVTLSTDDDSADVLIPPNDPRAEGWAFADAMRPVIGFDKKLVETVVAEWEERLDTRLGKKPEVMTPDRAKAKARANRKKAGTPRKKGKKNG